MLSAPSFARCCSSVSTLRLYIWLACIGMRARAGCARADDRARRPSITVSPSTVSSQLPPVSAARSTITEPGRMLRTISAVIEPRRGAPGICAVRDDEILIVDVLADRRERALLLVVALRLGVAALVLGARAHEVGRDELRAEAFTCSRAAARTSKAPTLRRRAGARWRWPAAPPRRRRSRTPSPA